MKIFQTSLTRRALIAAAACTLLSLQAGAQTQWPTKPIKLIVPFAPGASNDIISLVLGSKLSARLGQTVIIENKGGAGGTIGTDFVAKSVPDGYTLLFVSTSISTNVASGKKLPYDLMKDLEPISEVAISPLAVVVGNNVKATTLRELIDLARAKPKGINYGTAGIGGINHLGTELLASATKIQLTHVPYKGMGPAFTDLMGGNLQMLVPTVASVIQQIKSGNMRALAVTSRQRSPLAPEIPTVSEAGVPGFQLEVWYGLMGPSNLPKYVVQRMRDELKVVLAMPEVQETLAREGATPQLSTPEEFRSLIQSDITRWARLIKDEGIELE